MLPPRREPSDETNQPHNAHRSAGVIHSILGGGVEDGEIEREGGEEEEDEADEVERDAPRAQGVRA